MLELREVTYRYGGQEGGDGIQSISLEIPREHIWAILGRSGAGKTTLLRCLGRFLQPQSGHILLNQRDIWKMPEREFRRSLGIVFQGLHLFPHLTVAQNIALAPNRAFELPEEQTKSDVEELLERFDISGLRDKYPAEISGGQAQRVAIARALILKPAYLLLDEPTAALDAETSREFGEFLLDLKSDTSFVVVTHDTLFVERIATHGSLLKDGKIAAGGSVADLVAAMKEPAPAGA